MQRALIALALFLASLGSAGLAKSGFPGCLNQAQYAQLRALGYAVVPADCKGVRIDHFSVARGGGSYEIEYRTRSGSTILLSGSRYSRPAHRGFFQQIGSALSHLGNHMPSANELHGNEANSNSAEGHETEEEMTGVTADSRVLGPMYFKPDNNCLFGQSDPSKGVSSAQFTLHGCGFSRPDPIIATYRSLIRIP